MRYIFSNDYKNNFITKREIVETDLKKRAGKCSFLLLIFGILTIAFTMFISIVFILLSNIKSVGFIRNNEYIDTLLGIIPCIILDIIIILIGLKITKIKFFQDILPKTDCPNKMVILAMLSCGGLVFISSIITSIYIIMAQFIHIKIPSPNFNMPQSMLLKIIYISYVCILGPILEEILFRGIILNYLKKYGELIAILFTTILFTMFHLNLMQFMTPIVLGGLLGFLAVKTNSIRASIMVHMFNNTVVTILSCLENSNKSAYVFICALYFIGGLSALVVFITKYYKSFTLIIKDKSIIMPLSNKLKNCIINSWFISYLVFYLTIVICNIIIENVKSFYG